MLIVLVPGSTRGITHLTGSWLLTRPTLAPRDGGGAFCKAKLDYLRSRIGAECYTVANRGCSRNGAHGVMLAVASCIHQIMSYRISRPIWASWLAGDKNSFAEERDTDNQDRKALAGFRGS